jgi:hypothetical protein
MSRKRKYQPDDEEDKVSPVNRHPLVCVATFLLSLIDTRRDRGVAKLCTLHVRLANECEPRILHFKVDARKSFSNAAFARYYERVTRAECLASTEGEEQRILLRISQREKSKRAFVGVKRDPTSASTRHPLVCICANTLTYVLEVHLATPAFVDLRAHFGAGQARLTLVSTASSASSSSSPASSTLPSYWGNAALPLQVSSALFASDEQLELTDDAYDCPFPPSPPPTKPLQVPRCEFMSFS